MQYNAHTNHLHPDSCKHCTRGAATSIALAASARRHRHVCEVVSDKASKLSTQTQSSKILQVVIKAKQSDAVPSL